ncbi:MAG: HAD-IA family hydrolase [Candidatus Cloacimonetes bacterium]|nr:HAD-IA family hydrolase [Candidatus Cloacimonadota bacterium]
MDIKNVIFDLGKVLIDFNFSSFWESIGTRGCERFLNEAEEPILLFEAGKISRISFFNKIRNIYNFEMSLNKFEKVWCNVFSENQEVINLARKLSGEYNVFIFSNTDEIHFPYIWEKYPSLHFFGNNLMLSYKLNAVKPEIDIYLNAMNKFNLKPEECLLIDDRPVNINTAESIGMKGIIHSSFEETKEKIGKILTL